jgi:hypothetical protein
MKRVHNGELYKKSTQRGALCKEYTTWSFKKDYITVSFIERVHNGELYKNST